MKFVTKLFILLSSIAALGGGSDVFAAVEADLLAAYDQTYASSVGGADNAMVAIANAVASNNLYNDRSGTGAHMRVVGYYQAAQYSYKRTSNGGFVGWLANYNSNLSDVVDAGNAAGADLVMFICDSTDDGAAAVAQQPGRYSSLDATYFFSILLAHETGGHNYGRSHSDGLLSSPKTIMLHNYCGGGSQGWYTNPNIWVNGKRLVGDGATACPSAGATAVNGGDNSNPSAESALGVAQRYERVVYGPNLNNVIYDWRFTNAAGSAPSGTVVTDLKTGTAAATVLGAGATFTGSALRIPGGASGSSAAYLQLPGGIISSQTAVTIEIWATPLSAQNFGRILDFNNGSNSYLTLAGCVGTNLSAQRFESKLNGATVSLDSALYTAPGVPHHYAVTFTPASSGTTGTWRWYRDGDLITYLNVAYPLSSLPDVNNWLGRSAFSTDAFANNDYAQVRISNAALSDGQIQANYQLGPNYTQAATATMSATDASGASSFNVAGKWSNGAAPSGANTYETYNYVLRTPANATSYTFGGNSLSITGGKLLYKSTGGSTITVNNLKLDNGTVYHNGSGTFTLNGSIAVADDGATVVADNGGITLNSSLSGTGSVTYYGANSTTLKGTNTAFSGKTLVGNGYRGNITIDSEARLGPNPSAFTADQLQFNRGTLTTTQTMSLGNPNRGIYFDVDGGAFNVASGTTLTLTSPLSSVDMGTGVIASSIGKAGAGTLILSSAVSAFNGTLYVDSGGNGSNDGIVRVANNQVLANAKAIYILDTNACTSTLQMDGSTGNIALPSVTAAARSTTVPQVQSLSGSNSISGYFLAAGGTNQLLQADAGATLTVNGPIYSTVTGDRTITFQGAGNLATTGTMSNLTADSVGVVKTGTGTLTVSGACTYTGTTTINGGAYKLNGTLNPTTASASTLTAAAGTIFGGTGTTNVTVAINGTHAPGNAVGAQTFNGPLTYNAAAKLNWLLLNNGTAASASNKVAAQGVTVTSGAAVNLGLNGTGSTVDFSNVFWTQPHTWTVLTSTTMSGQFTLGSVSADSAGHAVAGYGSFSLKQTATGVTVVFNPLNATPPTSPTGLSAAGSPGAVTLTWTLVSGATSYNVKRSTSPGGPYETIATDLTGTSFADTAVSNGTVYYYVITAVNPSGESDESTEVVGFPHLPSTIAKADNATALNQPGSWTGGILPSAWDTASWTGLGGANSVLLGSNVTLNGIVVGATGGAVSIGVGNTLTLGMGGIDVSAATQNLSIASGLTLGAGNQTWNVATGKTLALTGTFARNAGSTLLIDKSANAGTIAASPTLVNSLLPWAVVKSSGAPANKSANGYTYATASGGSVVAFANGTASGFNWTSGNDSTFNYDVSATTGQIGVNRVANTVRYIGAAGTQNFGSSNTTTLTLNGLLNAGTDILTLSQVGGSSLGQVAIGANNGNELDLIAANNGLTIAIPIVNTGSTPGSVVVAGTNVILLSSASTYSGGTALNSGELHVGLDSTPTSGTVTSGPIGTGALTINGGTLTARNANRTLANAVTVGGDFTLNGNIGGASNANLLTLSGTVNLGGGVRGISVTATGGAAISGVVSNGGLIKSGTAALALGGANTYGGGTTLNAGALQLGHASALGAGAGSLTVNGGALNLNAFSPTVGALSGTGGVIANLTNGASTLTTNSSASSSFAGALQNGAAGQILALTKQGAGTLTLTGTNTYTGATTISAGTLRINGALTGNSTVTVGNGGALAGSGTSSGPVTVASGGGLAPGDAVGAGTLTISGALTLNNGSVLTMNLAAPGASAKVAVGGVLNTGGTTTLNIKALDGYGAGVYPLITGTAAINASNFALGTTPNGYAYALSASNGTLSLTVAAPLAAPTGLTATGGNSSVALSWTAVAGAASYNVKRSIASGGGYVTIASGVTATNYTDAGLTGGTAYFYVVSAVNLAGESDDSGEAGATALTASDAWRLQNFGENSNNNGVSGDTADPDGDGVPNLLEYALGSGPNTASTAGSPQAAVANGKLTIAFTRNTAATDVTMSVMAADTPGGPWIEIARSTGGAAFNVVVSGASVSEVGAGATRTVQVGDIYSASDAAHPKRFLKLQVSH